MGMIGFFLLAGLADNWLSVGGRLADDWLSSGVFGQETWMDEGLFCRRLLEIRNLF